LEIKLKSDTGAYWDDFYNTFPSMAPSHFCNYVIEGYLKPEDHVIEIGCGNGRDGLALANFASAYTGVDISESAIRKCVSDFSNANIDSAKYEFKVSDFAKIAFRAPKNGRLVIYSRFSLHADTEAAQTRFLENVASVRSPLLVAIEARTIGMTPCSESGLFESLSSPVVGGKARLLWQVGNIIRRKTSFGFCNASMSSLVTVQLLNLPAGEWA
jgi:SAM-dependent methyltransferase